MLVERDGCFWIDEDSEKDNLPKNKLINGVYKGGSYGYIPTGKIAISVEGGTYMFSAEKNEWQDV